MTTRQLLGIIDELAQQKRLKAIKVWDVIEYAQNVEDVEKEEVWMLIRTLERRGCIDLIVAEQAGIVAVSLTPIGLAQAANN